MAFRGSELRLILGIQSYGTANVARLRRDITALGRTVDLANVNQERVAAQAARSMEKAATIRNRIATQEARIAERAVAADAARESALSRNSRNRSRLLEREGAIASQVAAKRLQIAGTEAAISRGTTGSAALRQQVAQMRLGSQLERLADSRITLAEKELGIQSQIRTNRATQIGLARQLNQMGVPDVKVEKYRQANANLGGMGSKMRQVVLRLQAADLRATKLQSTLAGVAAEGAIIDREVANLNVQERKVLAAIDEQVSAMGRARNLLRVQQSQLEGIEARQSAIAAELAEINMQESRINSKHTRRMTTLAMETAELEEQKRELLQQEAITQRLLGDEMARARAMDAAAVRAQKLGKQEVLGRTVAHAGRTAQFGGLVATAGFAAAGNAAAEFDKKAQLAGTQMRDVNGTFVQAKARGQALQTQIISLMKTFPSGAEEFADSAYEIFSSMNLVRDGVVNVEEGYKLMSVAAKMAVAGQVDLGEATSAMITVLNNFDPELKNVNQTMNEVFAIVRFGQMRLSDFAAAMVPLAPVAKTVGLSLVDVGAALSTLTILMKSPQQAAQGLARAIELLQLAPFQKGLEKAGVQVTDLATGRMRPLIKIMRDLSKTFPEATTSQRSMVDLLTRISKASGMTKAGIQGTVQARRALAGLITSMGLYENILKNISGSQQEFNDAFNAMKDTPGVQWALFINQIKAFALVVGQAALPYLLQLGEKLVDLAHWLERLIKNTDGAVVKWGVFGAAIALVGGTVLNMVGSLMALAANMRIATAAMITMEGAATKASVASRLLGASLLALTGIGIIAIPIILQMIKGGEPGLWDFLGAAGAGAVGGAMIGSVVPGVGTLAGAAVGGIVVPVVIKIMSDPENKTKLQNEVDMAMKMGGKDALPRQFQEMFIQMGGTEEAAKKVLKIYKDSLVKIPKIGEDIVTGKGGARAPKKKPTWMENYEAYLRAFTKAQLDAQNAWFDQMAEGEDKADTAARLAKARAKVVSQAWENMQQKIDQAVDKLGGVYDKFLSQNQAAMGELGKGPVISGFMGDIFRGLNDLMMQFGTVVAIPPSLINRDLEIQMKLFDRLRAGYAELIRKGVPAEVVQQIQSMGMDALPFVEGLMQMSGPTFDRWKKSVTDSHDKLVAATQIDFDAQLKIWKKYGSDIATKMMEGLSSDAAKAVLKEGFRTNVIDLFGEVFREEMAAEIAAGLKEIAEGEAARIAAEKKAKKAREAARKAQGLPPLKDVKPGKVDPKTGKAVDDADKAYPPGRDPRTGISYGADPRAIARGEEVGRNRFVTPAPKPTFAAPSPFDLPTLLGGAKAGTTVNNYGDTNTIHADGVHPAKVNQAMNKQGFQKRNKKRPGVS